jgi:hypothetical protein
MKSGQARDETTMRLAVSLIPLHIGVPGCPCDEASPGAYRKRGAKPSRQLHRGAGIPDFDGMMTFVSGRDEYDAVPLVSQYNS